MNAALIIMGGGLAIFVVVLAARAIEASLWRRQLTAYRLEMPQGLTQNEVSGWLAALGAATRHIPAVIELLASSQGITHYLLAPRRHASMLLRQVHSLLPGTRTEPAFDYTANAPTIRAAGELRVTSTSHPLAHDRASHVAGALLSVLQPLKQGEQIRISWLLAGTVTPHPAGAPGMASDLVRFRRMKHQAPLLRVCGRIGVVGLPPQIARALLYRVYSTLRMLDAPGAAMVRRTLPWRLVAARLRERAIPLTIWPALLNTRELAGLLALPLDGVSASGLGVATSRQLPVPPDYPSTGLLLAYSNYPGLGNRSIGLKTSDRLRHVWLVGPTGTGKSTLLANMALQDARKGYGLVVIDPKSDLCDDILARLPDKRRDDVVILNPGATDRPVGFNVLQAARDEQSRELVVDDVVRIFADLWKSSFGPRTADVLRNALLTLTAAHAPNGSAFTLAEVAPLLENPAFRRYVTTQRGVPESVRSFWMGYAALSPGELARTISPSLNKLRALTTRTSLRLMLGQSTGLDISDVFTKRRILIVALNKGVIGSETAVLLGSLITATLWNATLRRAAFPASERHPVWAYLDEFQDVLRMGGDVADALAQARGLGLGLVLAHQYLGQLPAPLQAAVMGTARSSVVFQLNHPGDARSLEQHYASALSASDLMGLRAYEVAMRLCVNGQTRPPVTGRTMPLDEPIRDATSLIRASRARFGVPRSEAEAALRARVAILPPGTSKQFGRRHGVGA